jgi:urate oxidase
MKLVHNTYGKARVRVMKVSRAGAEHSLKELEVSVMLQGDFETSYTEADNRLVVPTDTMKNTVYILAKDKLGDEAELFGLALGQHFLNTYPQIAQAEIALAERFWDRMMLGDQAHPHSFIQNNPARALARVVCSRSANQVESGIEDLFILKATGSGFSGYAKDAYTTLPETTDRLLATKLKATWAYSRPPSRYKERNAQIVTAMLKPFADNFSTSVQATLFQMGQAALQAAPEISKITLAMPNKHYLLANLAPFRLENRNEVFIPTDEPHGQIEGTICRE